MYGRLRDHGVAVVAGVDSGDGATEAARQRLARGRGPSRRRGSGGGGARHRNLGGGPSLRTRQIETGRLAAGYAADVLVVDGDLAEDVTLLSTPREILVREADVGAAQEVLAGTEGGSAA